MQTTMKNLGTMTLAAALLAGTCLFSSPAKADVAAAEATFKAKCAMCHGADGKGKESMKTPDFTSADVQKKSDADLSGVITNGKRQDARLQDHDAGSGEGHGCVHSFAEEVGL